MRFAQVRIAVVTILSGSFLALSVLGTAHAAAASTDAAAPSDTDTVCQALPASASPSPSPSPSTSPSPSPSPSPSSSSPSAPPSSDPPSSDPPSSSPPASQSNSPVQTGSPSASANQSPSPTGSGSASSASSSPSGSASSSLVSASLDAYIATTPSPSPSSTDPAQLCVSVQRLQASIKRGQTASYDVNVSAKNGSASDVTVALTALPASQKPEFTSGCSTNGTASCTLSSVTDKQATDLKAQVAVASSASSVTSVKLTATASVTTTAKWTAPAAAESTTVTAAAAASASPTSSASVSPDVVLPLGPIPNLNTPDLNTEASLLIGAGNASNLFPSITPASTLPAGTPGSSTPTRQQAGPVVNASPVALGSPVMTAQVTGLIALGVAILLTVTRLSVRKRPRPGQKGN